MFDRDKWAEIFDSIGKNKLRTILTGFAVFFGIWMLIVLLGAGSGLRNGFEYGFRNTAKNSIEIWGGETSKPWKGLPANRYIQLDADDISAFRSNIPGLINISGEYRLWRGESTLNWGKNYGNFGIKGIQPEIKTLESQVVITGRFINEVDHEDIRKVIVLSEDARDALFKNKEDPMHQWVQVNGIPFEVVGVYKFESGGHNQGQSGPVFIPLSVAQRVFNARNYVDKIMFSFSDASLIGSEQAVQRARSILATRHQFDPTDDRAIWINNNIQNSETMGMIFGGITAFLWFIGIGSIVAGIVGVSNIMLIVVKERTREIGVRKALGATPMNVIGQIMMEALFVTGVAGWIGLVLAVLLLEWLASAIPGSEFFRDPTINIGVALWALFVLILAGGLAGFFPARRAARIRPIEALREE